jgi:predicted ATPase
MNSDQRFAFNIVLKTIQNYLNEQDNFISLRMIVSGTAGSGKSYLIKCLVKVIRTIFASKRSVQVLCPTGNSANIISGLTLHSFLKIPTN